MNLPRNVVETVVSFVGKKTNEAFRSNNSVELSGFGSFKISMAKIKRKKKYLNQSIERLEVKILEKVDSKLTENRKLRLEACKKSLELLNQKENAELFTNN